MLADLDTVKAAISDRSRWTETILSLSSSFSSFSVGYCKCSLYVCKRKTSLDPTDIRRCVSLTWEGCPDNASKRKDDLHLTKDSTLHEFLTTRLSDWEAAELHSCRNEKSIHCNIFARKDVEINLHVVAVFDRHKTLKLYGLLMELPVSILLRTMLPKSKGAPI